MTDPYSAPESDLDPRRGSKNIPMLWTLYNGYVLFSVLMIVIFLVTGKTADMFRAMVGADPMAPADSRGNAIAFGLLVINYLVVLFLIGIGYLLVWRVNRRGRIGLAFYILYMIFMILLNTYSFVSIFDLAGYRLTLLDYFANLVSLAWLLALLAWAIRGWRRYPPSG